MRHALVLSALVFILLIPIAYAVVLEPHVPGHLDQAEVDIDQNFDIKTLVYYDYSLDPVTDAAVYYKIVSGASADCQSQTYSLTLNRISDNIYCSGSDCDVPKSDDPSMTTAGTYTVCVKATKPNFRDAYSSGTLTVKSGGGGCDHMFNFGQGWNSGVSPAVTVSYVCSSTCDWPSSACSTTGILYWSSNKWIKLNNFTEMVSGQTYWIYVSSPCHVYYN
jgi:hypothetical protein